MKCTRGALDDFRSWLIRVGVGKTFLAHAMGHIACRRRYSVFAVRTDHMLKTLKHGRLDHTYEAEVRKLLAVDLLTLDDFALDEAARPDHDASIQDRDNDHADPDSARTLECRPLRARLLQGPGM